jgi:pyruvate-formate lyase-activating enzyme
MNTGDIVTVLTVAGEFVGKLQYKDGDSVSLADPRMLVQGQNGMGFARGVCVTGEENPTQVEFMGVVFVTPTNNEVASAWRQATSGIIA